MLRSPASAARFAHSVSSPTPTQLAAADFLKQGGYDRHVRRLRRALGEQSARYRAAIARSFPEGTRVSPPQGAFFLWVELPDGASKAARAGSGRRAEGPAVELQLRALDRGIAIAPGPIFSARQRFGNCIRLSTGHPFTPRMESAVAVLGELAHELRAGR